MPTWLPEEAMIAALASYLRDALTGEADFADSEVIAEWPEPTEDLRLDNNRIVVSIIRAGASEGEDRLGAPEAERITLGTAPVGTVRYAVGQVDQPITIGVWASTAALRNDADLFVADLLNQPMWSTVAPRVLTTLAVATTKLGEQLVVPTSMADIWPGCTLEIDTERVVVRDILPTSFRATLRKKHAAAVSITEVEGRRESIASGLHLRCDNHYGNLAHFLFDDGVASLDDAEGGRGRQRQEWRSVRQGVGSIMRTREVTGVVLQKRLTTVSHVSTDGGEVASPIETQVFP